MDFMYVIGLIQCAVVSTIVTEWDSNGTESLIVP